MGPSGETILDYSVFDALRAGFGKVVFVIRPDFEQAFKERVVARFAARTARALGPKARCWTVLNEPLVLVLGGYLDGWEPRFGLLELDRETLARRERPSARTFRRLASGYLGRPLPPRQPGATERSAP